MNFRVLAEVFAVFLLVETRILFFDRKGLISWLAILPPLAIVLHYWYRHREKFKECFTVTGSRADRMLMVLLFVIFWQLIALVAELWNPNFLSQEDLPYKFGELFLQYLPWALMQQLVLNGYVVNRIQTALQNTKTTSVVAGLLFGTVHLPNPVLVPVTFLGGMMSAYFFQRARNIYLLALCHTILSVSVKYFLPVEWHHNLRVGPRFFTWRP